MNCDDLGHFWSRFGGSYLTGRRGTKESHSFAARAGTPERLTSCLNPYIFSSLVRIVLPTLRRIGGFGFDVSSSMGVVLASHSFEALRFGTRGME